MIYTIKKEDIKEDITIKFDGNIVFKDCPTPFIKFKEGKLVIELLDLIIADKDIVSSVNLTRGFSKKYNLPVNKLFIDRINK